MRVLRRVLITPASRAAGAAFGSLAAAVAAQRSAYDEWRVWLDDSSGEVDVPDWAVVSKPEGAYRVADTLRFEPCFAECVDEDTAYVLVTDSIGQLAPDFCEMLFGAREATRHAHAIVYANVDDGVAADVVATEPRALDAFAWIGSEFVHFRGRVPLDGVEFLGRTLPERVGRPNLVCAAARCGVGVRATTTPQPWPAPPPAKQPKPEQPEQPEPEQPEAEQPRPEPETAPAPAEPEPATPQQPPAAVPEAPPAAPQKKRVTRRRIVAA